MDLIKSLTKRPDQISLILPIIYELKTWETKLFLKLGYMLLKSTAWRITEEKPSKLHHPKRLKEPILNSNLNGKEFSLLPPMPELKPPESLDMLMDKLVSMDKWPAPTHLLIDWRPQVWLIIDCLLSISLNTPLELIINTLNTTSWPLEIMNLISVPMISETPKLSKDIPPGLLIGN